MKAVILSGGLGTCLRPFTEVIPKPLLSIGEKVVYAGFLDKVPGYQKTNKLYMMSIFNKYNYPNQIISIEMEFILKYL
ncbi:MAG TPA: sugar phosphate nucleotidyltransferase [Caldisericia bacterium]|mgnify:CR=1 FL=1|nr:sugar phosphate nucleotidyltransferase [Caldisericia bacterium]